MEPIVINGRRYAHPGRPVVVVCLDGCAPEYLERAAEAGCVPTISRLGRQGTFALVQGNMPSYTNPNNVSLVCGVRPDLHGISGNHFLAEHGREVQMTEPEYLRCPTILAALSEAGLEVCCVTAKEKLRRLLGSGLSGCSISGEHIAVLGEQDPEVGELVRRAGPPPGIYSGELSAYVLDLGLALLDRAPRPDVLYLSLTDYVPHKYAPGEAHLAGAIDAVLHEINIAYDLELTLERVSWKTVGEGLASKQARSPAFTHLASLRKDPGSWMSLLYELRNHGTHRRKVGKAIEISTSSPMTANYIDPRTGAIQTVFPNLDCGGILDAMMTEAKGALMDCRKSDSRLAQPDHREP